MTIGIVKGETLVALKTEVTEGTPLPPASGDDYIQVLEDGLELSPAKELVERSILTSSIGKVSPRASLKSVSGSIPVEVRGSGTEGDAPQFEVLLDAALGNKVSIAARITTDTGHTTTALNKTSHGLVKGQMFVILEAGAHHTAFVTDASDPDVIVFAPATDSAPSDNVEISESITYYPANSGQPTFTTSVYWGDEIRERGIGCRVNSLALENFTTGQIANFNFGMEGLSFDESDTSSPFTPSFDPGLPPLVLSAVVYQNGVCIDVNEFCAQFGGGGHKVAAGC